jgi:DNA-binding response OmpR family regulator
VPLKARDYAKLNVLLLESSGPMRSAIFYMLRDLGVVNLSVASLGPQVLELFDEHDFDVILLGHNGRDATTGIQLLEEARFRGYMRPTAGWILMTSDSSQEVILHALDSHPDDLITKPFSQHELEQRISSLVLLKSSLERPSVCALR